MAERVGVVGSRTNPPLEQLEEWLLWLWENHPETILVSGGADGVDKFAEDWWMARGGAVESYRVWHKGPDIFGVTKWTLGPAERKIENLEWEPSFETYESALWYRSMLVAEAVSRLVAFYAPGWPTRGTEVTVAFARAEGDEVFEVKS